VVGGVTLLEREQPLRELAGWWSEACGGHGCLVLIDGEAGIGKTAMVRELERRVSGRKLLGGHDPLSIARPLGPLIDIAPQIGGTVARQLATGEQVGAIFAALVADLEAAERPTLLVIEDAHWADASSLDLLRFLARRIGRLRAMLVVTFRGDEAGPLHPLRITLGDLASSDTIRRVPLKPLSVDAVRELAAGSAVDAVDLHRRTGGNPFFATEALAEPEAWVPATVRDAVMARVARLTADERAALEAMGVLGARVPSAWVDAMVGRKDALATCTARGLICIDGELVAFRHELARDAVLATLTGEQRRAWHARALTAIAADRRGRREQLAALAHHAEGAADPVAAREYGIAAAREASRLRAHRQAAEHYALALRHFPPSDSREHAEALEAHAYERYLTDEAVCSIELCSQAAEMWLRLGDRVRYADNLRCLSRVSWFAGRTEDARDYARRAIETLERHGKGRELAAAYSNQAHLHMLSDETALALRWGRKAVTLARRVGDLETEVHAGITMGYARAHAGDPAGLGKLQRSLALAREAHLEDAIARALTCTSTLLVARRDLARASAALAEALAFAEQHDLEPFRLYLLGQQALAVLHSGRLAEAIEISLRLLDRRTLSSISRIQPLIVLGRARARRGDRDVWAPLDEALALADQAGEVQRIGPVRLARGEAAWLEGDVERARREVKAALPLAQRLRAPWYAAELMFVLALTGERRKPPPWIAHPYALHLSDQFAAAARAWSGLGCPYEQAWSLAGDGSETGLRAAFEILDRLGMRAAAARVAERLRMVGARVIPRGRRASTRANVAGLTARQLDVLALISEGLKNIEIGRRLFISPKTVDHHVSAILDKIDVGNRVAAARWYRQQP
jgi:DNA-binding CsgD family transcriptional regulator/tetratricopeptide (TPR) repeat protein